MNTTTTKELPPIAETDSHQGRMIRANRARQARRERIPAVVAERNELAVKCAQWAQMFDDKCKTLSQVTAQRDELLAACQELHRDLYDLIKSTKTPLFPYLSLKRSVAAQAAISKAEQH